MSKPFCYAYYSVKQYTSMMYTWTFKCKEWIVPYLLMYNLWYLGDFHKEDLVRSLVVAVIMDMVQHVHLTAISQGIKHVFFSGSFINTFLMRYLITTEFARRNAFHTLSNGKVSAAQKKSWRLNFVCWCNDSIIPKSNIFFSPVRKQNGPNYLYFIDVSHKSNRYFLSIIIPHNYTSFCYICVLFFPC